MGMSCTFAAHARIMTARRAGKTNWEWADLANVSDLETIGDAMPQVAEIRAEAPWVRPDRYADRLKRYRAQGWHAHLMEGRQATPRRGCPWLLVACLGASAFSVPQPAGVN
jgi:hypothetical protein